MSAINTTSTTSLASATSNIQDRMNDLQMDDFIKMMVAELQNQDPTNPMSNTDMLSQIGQMRSITSNDRLSSSIESMALGQSLTTAASLIGKIVTGTSAGGLSVEGKVDMVTVENGVPKLHVGTSVVDIGSVTAING